MATTLRDIARRSGISMSTVSRVLNKKTAKYRISKETEKLVLKTARELNYFPNQLARGLRLKKTQTIGLVAPDISNPFFAYIIKKIQTLSHQLGYSLVVCDTDESLSLEVEHVRLLYSKGVDGLIVMPVGQVSSHLEFLVSNNVPLVLVDRCFDGLRASTVVVDNFHGAYEAVDFIARNGHRRIAIIQGLAGTFTSSGRLRGYEAALKAHGIPLDDRLIVGNDFRILNGYTETKCLLRMSDGPTAIFTTSDLITLGALEALDEEDIAIPEEMSIVAFDDIEPASLFRCPITAVAQPKDHIGEIAVKLLTEQMRSTGKREPKNIVLKPELIIRESVAVSPGRRADAGAA